MSYGDFQGQTASRPGFTEQATSFEGGGFSQGNSYGSQANAGSNTNASGYGQNGGSSNYGNNNRSGYSGSQNGNGGGGYNGGRSNYNGSNGGNSNWKGNSSGGGWKGGSKGGFQKPPMTPEQLAAVELPKRSIILAGNYGAPDTLSSIIREIADIIQSNGFVVRGSSMDGFDKMVMDNVRNVEYHIPWKEFGGCSNPKSSFSSDVCKEFAKRYLPEWSTLKESHQGMFCKNPRLVLGKNLDAHAYAAIIWSDDGVESPANRGQRSAHAGHIAAICHACGIPVINISNPNAVQRLRDLIQGNKNHG